MNEATNKAKLQLQVRILASCWILHKDNVNILLKFLVILNPLIPGWPPLTSKISLALDIVKSVCYVMLCYVIYLFEQVEVLAATKLMWTCYTSGRSRGGARGAQAPPYFGKKNTKIYILVKIEAKIFFGFTHSKKPGSPLAQGLDPPLYTHPPIYSRWEVQWPHGECARLRIEWFGFGAWPGTLCCVLGQDTLLSRCLSPPRCINGYWRNAGGNPAMD